MGKIKAGPCPARVTVFSPSSQDPHRDSSRSSPFLPSFPVPPPAPGGSSCPYMAGFSRGSTPCLVGPKLPARVYTYEIQLQIIALAPNRSRLPARNDDAPRHSSLFVRIGASPRRAALHPPRRFPSPTFQPSEPAHGCPVYKHGQKHVISRDTQTLRTLGTREHLHAAENVATTRPSILYLRLFQQAARALPLLADRRRRISSSAAANAAKRSRPSVRFFAALATLRLCAMRPP